VDKTADIDLTDETIFRHWTPVSIRFSDQDSLGHVNNVAYAAYAEAGRVAYIRGTLSALGLPTENFMLASVKIDYRNQMHYPGTVDVGSCILRLGNTSITIGQGFFKDGGMIATGQSVIVIVDLASGKPTPIPGPLRAALEKEHPA
jgi:acyl-CoA thioester hydrolase